MKVIHIRTQKALCSCSHCTILNVVHSMSCVLRRGMCRVDFYKKLHSNLDCKKYMAAKKRKAAKKTTKKAAKRTTKRKTAKKSKRAHR